jgi:glycosyltransferase involved in cell wall biosynthesis
MPAPLVSLIVVTKRPTFLPAIMAMMARQDHQTIEVIVCLHGHEAVSLDAATRAALAGARHVLQRPEATSLGACLNAAIAEARGDFVAKVDDDDIYGRGYLSEAVRLLREGRGEVVGKAEHFVYLRQTGQFVLRRAGESHQVRKFVAGPTLVLPRRLASSLPFPDLRTGEDTVFLRSCFEAGVRVYSSSRKNYIYIRRGGGAGHTWLASDQFFVDGGQGIPLRCHPDLTSADLLRLIEA